MEYVRFEYLNGYAMFSVWIVKQLCYAWICFAAVLRKNDQKPFKQGMDIFSTTMTAVGHLYVMNCINSFFINYLTCQNVCYAPSQNNIWTDALFFVSL